MDTTTRDYSKLRRSFELVNKVAEKSKTEAELLEYEKDDLLDKLVVIERQEKVASKEVEKLRGTCRKLKQDKKLNAADVEAISDQRDMLLDKLGEFERKYKDLRKLLNDSRRKQDLYQDSADRCEILMQKLTEAEATIQNQAAQLIDQDKQIDTLITHVEADKHQAHTFDELKKTMESTRAHLQNQLRIKEAENNRLSIQCSKLEQNLNARSVEAEHYQGLMVSTTDKSQKDKEALKKATRIQRERAQKQEEINEDLQIQLTKLLEEVDKSKVTVHELTNALEKLKQDNNFIEEESKLLRKHVNEMGSIMEFSSKSMKAGPVYVVEKLASKIRLMKSVKLENDNLQEELKALEEKVFKSEKNAKNKLKAADSELIQLRSALEQYEGLTTEYKSQLEKYRQENEDIKEKLREKDKELKSNIHEHMVEVGEVRNTFERKLVELECYPELLKTCEIRLQDTQERAVTSENRANEHTKIIAELTQKVELQSEQLGHLREKYHNRNDANKVLEHQLISVERKMHETDGSHRDLVLSHSRKDEALQALQNRLEEQHIENERLIHQLEVALSDAKKQAEAQKEKAFAKERSAQARIMDLESQLSRSTQNTQLLKRSKEEAEKKFNSRLQDMRDRLEQANSTTRSMQNYVQFLKSTYANVFSDDFGDEEKFRPMPF